eukprot:6190523-Pleurochrysis_carterae.AAC.2
MVTSFANSTIEAAPRLLHVESGNSWTSAFYSADQADVQTTGMGPRNPRAIVVIRMARIGSESCSVDNSFNLNTLRRSQERRLVRVVFSGVLGNLILGGLEYLGLRAAPQSPSALSVPLLPSPCGRGPRANHEFSHGLFRLHVASDCLPVRTPFFTLAAQAHADLANARLELADAAELAARLKREHERAEKRALAAEMQVLALVSQKRAERGACVRAEQCEARAQTSERTLRVCLLKHVVRTIETEDKLHLAIACARWRGATYAGAIEASAATAAASAAATAATAATRVATASSSDDEIEGACENSDSAVTSGANAAERSACGGCRRAHRVKASRGVGSGDRLATQTPRCASGLSHTRLTCAVHAWLAMCTLREAWLHEHEIRARSPEMQHRRLAGADVSSADPSPVGIQQLKHKEASGFDSPLARGSTVDGRRRARSLQVAARASCLSFWTQSVAHGVVSTAVFYR